MNRYAFGAVALFVGLVCGCEPPHDAPADEPPPVKPKPTTLLVRSVRPADDSVTANKAFVVSYGLTRRDLEQMTALAGVADLVPMRHIPSEVKFRERAAGARVVAAVAGYADTTTAKLSAGRFLTKDDDTDKENFCVLGAGVAAELFPKDDPVGQTVDIRGHFFRVVGVFKERPAAEGAERDVYVPLGTSRRRFGDVVRDKNTKENQKVEFHEIVVRLKKPDDIAEVEKALRELLEKNHARKDWEITKR